MTSHPWRPHCGTFTALSPARAHAAAADASRRTPWLAPIFAAVGHGLVFGLIVQAARPRPFQVPPADVPAVFILGDDPDPTAPGSRGPAAFHRGSLARLLRRCQAVAVMAGAPVVAVYRTAAAGALLTRSPVVLVETTEHHEGDWWSLVERQARTAARLIVTPREGGRA